jgi:hypothetical protein
MFIKLRVICVLLVASLLFASCTKETTNVVNQAYSAVYTIDSTDWTTSDGGVTYIADLGVPELTTGIIQNGGVEVYLSFDGGVTYETIPEVYQGIAYGSLQQFQTVGIDITDVNGNAISAPTAPMLAKVVLIDAAPL